MAASSRGGAVKTPLVLLLLLISTLQNVSALELFFVDLDFSLPEGGGMDNQIGLLVMGTNTGPLRVEVDFFTYDQFADSGLSDPTTPLPTDLPDAAELEGGGGLVDFDATTVSLTIPANAVNDVEIPVPVTFTQDDINEAQEGLIVRVTIVAISDADANDLITSRRDTALLRIDDDDDITVGFNTNSLTVSEGDGVITGQVFVAIQDGGQTEQQLQYSIAYNPITATAGSDYQILSPINPSSSDAVLNFNSTLTSVEVSFEVVDDEVFESAMEQFSAQLGVITNTLEGLQQGIFTLTVSIVENDVITAGFLETVHRVSEGTAQLSVLFMILTPTDINQLSPTLFITLQATVTDASALSGQHFISAPFSFATLSQSAGSGEVVISSFTDDTEVNMDREFTITLSSPNPALADILDITVPTATVIIEDNDGAAADLAISPSPLLEVIEGVGVVVSCATTLSLDTLQLLVNGVAVDTAFFDAEGERFYQLGPADRQDDGNIFVCSSGTLMSDETVLVVFYPPVYSGEASFEEIEGRDLNVMLGLAGSPIPLDSSVEWTFNGQPLASGGRISLGLMSIEFGPVDRADAGIYTVTSSNVAGNDTFEFALSVLYPPVYSGEAALEEIEGRDLNVMLGLAGNPIPLNSSVEWTFNGQPLASGGRISLGLMSIEFGPVDRADAGIYTVTSSNVAGNDTFEFALSVLYPPVYSGEAALEEIEGRDLNVMLGLAGSPIPLDSSVEWTFNGQPLASGGRISLGLMSIEFGPVDRADAGIYTVTSSNVAGNDTFEFSLSVLFPPVYTVDQLFEVIEGMSLQIPLDLVANSIPTDGMFAWTFNGQPLAAGGGVALGVDSIGFDAVDRDQAGTYLIEATNEAGMGNATFTLDVFYPPQYTADDIFTVTEGEQFFLQLGLEANPMPLVSDADWALNGRPLVIMGGIDLGTDFINIQIATRLDEGNYTVNSSNVAGSGSTSFQLLVQTVTTSGEPQTTETPTTTGGGGIGGDPHFSLFLPTGQLLCFSMQGEHNFTFSLVSSHTLSINARFDQDAQRSEVTWIGALGVVVGARKNAIRIRFESSTKSVFIDNRIAVSAADVDTLVVKGGRLHISEASQEEKEEFPEVGVELHDVGVHFTVRFTRGHIDVVWSKLGTALGASHGLLGQFLRDGVEVDETRRLLQLPNMEPVPVMRKPVWHFMERETPEDQLCWVAMNPGYQGKHLIEGHYLDYMVDDVLSSKFKFRAGKYKKLLKLLKK